MNHEKAQIFLSRRAELSPTEEMRLRAHLAGCANCRSAESAYVLQDEAVRAVHLHPAASGVRSAVLTRIARGEVASGSSIRFPRAMFSPSVSVRGWSTRLVGLAVVALAVFGITRLAMLSSGGPPQAAVISHDQAVRFALAHSVAAPFRKLPASIKVSAHLSPASGTGRSWLVTLSGPGVTIVPPTAVPVVPGSLPTHTIHRETVVVDGHTGSFVETRVASE